MQSYATSPLEIFRSSWRNRRLISALTKREVVGRYQGSLFGLLWSLFNPILTLGVYTFVFSVVFKARWSGGSDSKAEFALVLFAGLFDMLDGQVARIGKMTSTFGALYDSVLDRYSELIMFLGICYYLVSHHYFLSSLFASIA